MKILKRLNADKAHTGIKSWSLKLVSTAVLACMASSAGHTSDLEIYQGATYGSASIMMMLDNSGSMDTRSIRNDYPIVTSSDSTSSENITQPVYSDFGVITGDTYVYSVTYVQKEGKRYYDRMSRLKMALMPMFANPRSESAFGKDVDLSKYKIGLGSFYFVSQKNGGKIINPVLDLTLENRKKLLTTVKSLSASTNTPTADAYAEAGAYMLGTSTASKSDDTKKIYKMIGESKSDIKKKESYEHDLEKCTSNKDKIEFKYDIKYKECDNKTKVQDNASSLDLSLLGGYDIKKIDEKEAYYFTKYSEKNGDIVYNFIGEVDIDLEDNGSYKYEIKKCNENKNDTKEEYGIKYRDCKSEEKYKGTTNNINDIDDFLRSYGYDIEVIKKEEVYYFRLDSEETIGSNDASGFKYSSDDTKVKPDLLKYDSPIKGGFNQCDGYGIYFLTDGEPNKSTSETINLMENSLAGSSLTMGGSCDIGLPSNGTYGAEARWECIGEYSKALYNKLNAKKTPIATATVGFGNVFKKLTDKGKITRTITRPSGAVETVQVYQCDASGIGTDAKNLCKLGEKGEGYGEGGFYYTEEPKDIADSVRKFIEDVSTSKIDPIAAGTMSVPLDSLGGLRSRQFAYLPILEPVPNSPLLWNGNLKKYKVKNATLVGSDNKLVFANNNGLFAQNTYDLWNTINDTNRADAVRPDGGAPQVGGAYQQVLENVNAAAIGNRNLFVDTGSTLTNLRVTDKKPENFNTLASTNPQKLALLNFMGYSEPDSTTVTDGQALTASQNKWLKNVGGVLHSIPQLITQKVNVKASGEFDISSRKDYVIYGSMDGALHMLDDSTGRETFTFVPKQILDLQPDALKGKGSAKDGSYPYGVDAPWLTYASYTTKPATTGTGTTATTSSSYESAQSFALGGLRMGGSMYYALDVTNVTQPKIIYGVGSNYANLLKGDTTALGGTEDNVTSLATDEQKAFSNMGQSWGKPTLGYVKSGGEKVMVSFLPGGYDVCYENPKFKLNTLTANSQCNKAAAQGSAVYMVQMGEVETQTNKEDTVNTAKDNGKLLWWAGNQGASSDSTSRTSSLQYSKADDLKHSVVTQIRALDRNYDGLIDHLYFADLGGQVWRVDINNDKDSVNFKIDRVVKILDVSDQVSKDDAPPRFYERPLITFYNGKYGYKDANNANGNYSGVQALVTVGTGDRSSPVSAVRSKPDALYSVIDKDVTRNDLFYYQDPAQGTPPTISMRTPIIKVAGLSGRNDNLQPLTFSNVDIGTTGIKKNMQDNMVQGWYMPFTHWLGADAGVGGTYKLKMFNEPDALAGVLISSSFNPDVGQEIKACSAGVRGETQRERTCLPYGVCLDKMGADVLTNRAFSNAGSGIVDNIVSQYNDTTLFTSLKNHCEGDSCKPTLICPNGDCDNKDFVPCVGPQCGVDGSINADKRINPLSWLEQ